MGTIDKKTGYGRIMLNYQYYLVHRLMYWITFEDPKEYNVLHSCDVRKCVNPKHLFLGTEFDNIEDMINKGRQPRGSNHGNAMFTEDDIRAIKQALKQGTRQIDLARKYKVDPNTIWRIAHNINWKHIS